MKISVVEKGKAKELKLEPTTLDEAFELGEIFNEIGGTHAVGLGNNAVMHVGLMEEPTRSSDPLFDPEVVKMLEELKDTSMMKDQCNARKDALRCAITVLRTLLEKRK